jgi:predicted transcriptional regulator
MCRSFHPDRRKPVAVSKVAERKVVTSDFVSRLSADLAKVIEESKANDPKALRARIVELEKQLKKPRDSAVDTESLAKAEREGFDKGVTAALTAIAGQRKSLVSAMTDAVAKVFADYAIVDAAPIVAASKAVGTRLAQGGRIPDGKHYLVGNEPPEQFAPREKPAKSGGNRLITSAEMLLPAGQAKVLTALIQYPEGLTREQLTVLSGYKRSTRDLYLQQLQRAGLATKRGDRDIATDAGRAALPNAEPLPTGEALRDHWLTRLPAGEKKVLEALIEAYPDALTGEELSERCGYLRSTRDLYVQQLGRRKLCSRERGQVKASPELFT